MSAISATGIYKIFGKNPRRGVEALRAGMDRAALREQGLIAAVIDASFEVAEGETFVVMGLSGSGKSTLIRMVNGLWPATSGHIEIGGEDVAAMSTESLRRVRREKISMVFQHFALLPHRTVGENAAYALELQGVDRTEREYKAEEALALVDLGGWGDSMPGELSGGMRQRVGLARALAAGTDIMLMDEAFSALDPLIRRGMQDQLVELQQKLGKTILFITHDLNEAMRLGDRIAMMRDGRIEQIGTAEDILNNPVNNYVAQFVQDVDRTRVITAANIMEPPVAVLGGEQGPMAAQKLLRENQASHLLVVNRDRRLAGLVRDDDIAKAVADRQTALPLVSAAAVPQVREGDVLADLFRVAAAYDLPLVVVDDHQRVVGMIPPVTLLSAGGTSWTDSPSDSPVPTGAFV